MRARPRFIATPAPALIAVLAAGVVIALRGCGSTGPAITRSEAAAVRATFLTAATMPQGLGGRAVTAFNLADAGGGTVSSAQVSGRPYR